MTDFTALQDDVAALGKNVAAVQAEVATLQSSSDQATVDALDADIKAANTALEGLLPAPPAPRRSVSLSPATCPWTARRRLSCRRP